MNFYSDRVYTKMEDLENSQPAGSYYPPSNSMYNPPAPIAQAIHVGCFDSRPLDYRFSLSDRLTVQDRIYNTWQLIHRAIQEDPEAFLNYVTQLDPDPNRPPNSPEHFQALVKEAKDNSNEPGHSPANFTDRLQHYKEAMATMTEETQQRVITMRGQDYWRVLMNLLSENDSWKNPWIITPEKEGQWMPDKRGMIPGYWVDSSRTDEETFSGKVYFELAANEYLCIPFSSH